ncbi:DnaJ domain-containing protein [Cryptosporidium parvum]
MASNWEDSLNPYSLLGVNRDASERDIRLAFLRLVRKFHPDKNISELNQEKDTQIANNGEQGDHNSRITVKYHALYDAYCILKDPEKRKEYDLSAFNESLSNYNSMIWHKSVNLEELEYMDEDGKEVFAYFCRCGGLIFLEKKHIEEGYNLFSCDGCSSKIMITF